MVSIHLGVSELQDNPGHKKEMYSTTETVRVQREGQKGSLEGKGVRDDSSLWAKEEQNVKSRQNVGYSGGKRGKNLQV